MHLKQKYIVTEDNKMIVFCELLEHKEFADWKPISAGFISIGTTMVENEEQRYPETTCTCYGESIILKLKSRDEIDTKLAMKQILGNYE